MECAYSLKSMAFFRGNDGLKVVGFDGTKLRLSGVDRISRVKETSFFDKSPVSVILPMYTHVNSPAVVLVMVKDQKKLCAFDENLNQIEPLALDVSMSIVSMCCSQKDMTVFVSGNAGWIKAFKLKVETGALGLRMSWVNVWTNHDSSQWMSNLLVDEEGGTLFASSGLEVFQWDWKNGQRLVHFETTHTMEITDLNYSSKRLMQFTASGDGTVRVWKIFKGIQKEIGVIKNKKCGSTLIALDDNYVFVISAEKILRQYDLSNLKLIGEFDFEPGVGIDGKKVEALLKFQICQDEKVLLVGIDDTLNILRVNSLPSEIYCCCNHVSRLFVDEGLSIYALCANNYIHVMSREGRDLGSIDLYACEVPMNVKCFCVHDGRLYLCCGRSVLSLGLEKKDKNEIHVGSDALSIEVFSYRKTPHMCKAPIVAVACHDGVSMFCDGCGRFITRFSTDTQVILSKFVNGMIFVLQAQKLSCWSIDESGTKQCGSVVISQSAKAHSMRVIGHVVVVSRDDGVVSTYDANDLTELNNFAVATSCISTIEWYGQVGLADVLCCVTKDGHFFQMGIQHGQVVMEKQFCNHSDFHCVFSPAAERPFMAMSTGNSVRLMDVPDITVDLNAIDDLSSESLSASDEQSLQPEPEPSPPQVPNETGKDPEPVAQVSTELHLEPQQEPELEREPLPEPVPKQVFEQKPVMRLGNHKVKTTVPVPEAKRENVDLVFVDGKPRLVFGDSPKMKREFIKTLPARLNEPPKSPAIPEEVPKAFPAKSSEPTKVTTLFHEGAKAATFQPDVLEQYINAHTSSPKTPVSKLRQAKKPAGARSSRSQINDTELYEAVMAAEFHPNDKFRQKPRPATRNHRGRTLPVLKNRNDDILQIFKLATPDRRPLDGRKTPLVDARSPKVIMRPRPEMTRKVPERRAEPPKRVLLVSQAPQPTEELIPPVQVEQRPKTQDTRFSKKNFVAKLDELPQHDHGNGGIAFTNGKILSTLKVNLDPNLEVLASAIHPDHIVDLFDEDNAKKTDLTEYSTSIELFYDILDGSSEASRALLRSSKDAQLKASVFSKPDILREFAASALRQDGKGEKPHPTKTKKVPFTVVPSVTRENLTLERQIRAIPESPNVPDLPEEVSSNI